MIISSRTSVPETITRLTAVISLLGDLEVQLFDSSMRYSVTSITSALDHLETVASEVAKDYEALKTNVAILRAVAADVNAENHRLETNINKMLNAIEKLGSVPAIGTPAFDAALDMLTSFGSVDHTIVSTSDDDSEDIIVDTEVKFSTDQLKKALVEAIFVYINKRGNQILDEIATS